MDDSLPNIARDGNTWCLVTTHQESCPPAILLGSPSNLIGISDANFIKSGFSSVIVGQEPSPCPWKEACDSAIYTCKDSLGNVVWMESKSLLGSGGALVMFTRVATFAGHEHLIRTSRLCMAGGLLGPMAHELNNIIQGLSSAEYLMRDNLESGEAVEMEDIDQLAEGVSYLRRLGAELQNFARIQFREHEDVDLRKLVTNCVEFLRSVGKLKTVELTIVLPDEIPDLYWRHVQLDFIVCALLCNAAEAALSGTRIPSVSLQIKVQENTIHLSCCDSGEGFDLQHNQVPFVSDKMSHRHSGLGLSAVATVVYSANGNMTQSVTESGNTIQLTLPIDSTRAGESTESSR